VRNAKKELEDFVEIKKPKKSNRSANNIDPQEMDWSTFLELVKADKTHGLAKRLRVLAVNPFVLETVKCDVGIVCFRFI
jgi:hypothetical protein